MDRRLFLLLTAAGAASPLGSSPAPVAPAAAAAPVAAPAAGPLLSDPSFQAWASDFQQRAAAKGFSPDFLRGAFTGLTPDPRVLALDNRQPEVSKPIGDYIRGAVSEDRIGTGRAKRALPWMTGLEPRFGVPAEILIGIWGMESAFGTFQGDMDVIRSVATLAAQGRRRDWAEGELLASLTILSSGEASRAQLKGSWAGAMGQTQFEPTAYLTTAVDGDGDGRRDIWASAQDALASSANLLSHYQWVRGQTWAREVILPAGFDYGLSEGPLEPPSWWSAKGVRRADGAQWPAADEAAKAGLIVPAGAAGPAFLVLPNHFVIRRYNNSTAYALAVGLLADRIGGAPPLVAAWPVEQSLTLAERLAAQQALIRLGFDPGEADGVIGVNTRRAIRAWQKARSLTADGYLNLDVVRRLVNDVTAS